MRIPVLCWGPIVESEADLAAPSSPASGLEISAAAAERARLTLTVQRLERQLEWLAKNGFSTPLLDEFVERRLGEATTRCAILTFDGGHEAHYRLVVPLLQRYKLNATFFIPNDAIDRPGGLARGEIEIMARWGTGIGVLAPHAEELLALSGEELRARLSAPRERLEGAIGRRIQEIAIPGPRIETSPLVRPIYEMGYRGLCTYTLGNHFEQDDMLIIARYLVRRTVQPDEWKQVVRMSSAGPAKLAFFVRPLK